MRKPHHGTAKRQGGLSLVPALWDEIDRIAKFTGVSRNRVIEGALIEAFGVGAGIQKTDENSRQSDEKEMEPLPR